MSRAAPSPDFRYVGLSPGPSWRRLLWATALASGRVLGVGLAAMGVDAGALALSGAAGAATAVAVATLGGVRLAARLTGQRASMALVPWGVVVWPDSGEERVLRWPAVRRVAVHAHHTRDACGNASTPWSVVTVETARQRLVGRAAGAVGLERLLAHLDAYADESSRPVALDLFEPGHGVRPLSEPVAVELIDRARALVASSRGVRALGLGVASSYRTLAFSAVTATTVEVLRGLLREGAEAAGDRRPLAAMVVAELGAAELLPDLLGLVVDVHPVVAAAAKAASLRLGADPRRVGALDEVRRFLSEGDLGVLEAWGQVVAGARSVGAR